MKAVELTAAVAGRVSSGYAGPDRRGIVAGLASRQAKVGAIWILASEVALPFAGVGAIMLVPGAPAAAAAVGAADTAVTAFVVTAAVLLFRRRVVGDAASVLLSAAAFLGGVLFVPASHLDGVNSGAAAAVRAAAVTLMLGCAVGSLAVPEIWARLRPTVVVAATTAAAVCIALTLALTPVAATMRLDAEGSTVAYGIEATACAVVAVALFVAGCRRRHLLLVGAGAAVVSIGANRVAHLVLDPGVTGAWTALPALLLLVGAVSFLLVAGADLRLALDMVVNHDLRGRRRWEAAESELAHARRVYHGRAHDITGILTAVDGSLFVLGRDAGSLQQQQRDTLITAMRDQVQHLRSLLTGAGDTARTYDLPELLHGVIAVHASDGRVVEITASPALAVLGHPDRVARIISNLLANASAHAPEAHIAIRVSSERRAHGDMVEITVADDGPGMTDSEMAHAFERGWRGERARGIPGSGLGLAQCVTLATAEGGDISLAPTNPDGPAEHRGLSARVIVPRRCSA